MKEIWDHAFGYARLKVERAEKHILEIEKRIELSSDSYGPRLHMDGKTREHYLFYQLTDRTLRSDLALITGDAIHNLHSALDIAWRGAVDLLSTGPSGIYTKFPFHPQKSKKEFELAISGNKAIPTPLHQIAINIVKAYKGGDSDLLAVHSLDINDKHKLMIPVLNLTSIRDAELRYKDGSVEVIDFDIRERLDSYRRNIPPGTTIKNHAKVRIEVTFGEGDLGGLEIISTLKRCSAKILKVVRIMQRTVGAERKAHTQK